MLTYYNIIKSCIIIISIRRKLTMPFISNAFAQTAQTIATQTPAAAGSGLSGIIQIFLICLVFYFILVRPHSKKMKEHQKMQGDIRRGDRIVTGGGVIAQVIKVLGDQELLVEIADGVRIKILRDSVGDIIGKIKPADSSNDDEDSKDENDADELKEALKKSKPKQKPKSKKKTNKTKKTDK